MVVGEILFGLVRRFISCIERKQICVFTCEYTMFWFHRFLHLVYPSLFLSGSFRLADMFYWLSGNGTGIFWWFVLFSANGLGEMDVWSMNKKNPRTT